MKRMHVHVSVRDLDASVRFYSTLFAATPPVLKADYAKWMLDELHEVYERLGKADAPMLEEGETEPALRRLGLLAARRGRG